MKAIMLAAMAVLVVASAEAHEQRHHHHPRHYNHGYEARWAYPQPYWAPRLIIIPPPPVYTYPPPYVLQAPQSPCYTVQGQDGQQQVVCY